MACDSPFHILPKAGLEKVPVPCGKCPECKRRRVNAWVFRLLQESRISTAAHFVTLTYDTRSVPISENGFMTLRKSDFQKFMKRLRKLCPGHKLKYYAVGEYGTQNKRPHYHAIIFNVPDERLFADAWTLGDSLGGVFIGKVSGDSIAYTMKYIDKPPSGKLHGRDDREREFPLMSKGLGANYITPEMVNYHQADLSRMYVTKDGGHKIAMPRYYRNKIYSEGQQKIQSAMAQVISDEKQIQLRREFDALGYPSTYSFEAWLDSRRMGRYSKFYANQKNRNV